jgi:hypothetical protein
LLLALQAASAIIATNGAETLKNLLTIAAFFQ